MNEFDVEEDLTLDPHFGLDRYVLPQFDLLVADGRITREFADLVIAERKALGYPMTPDELEVRPGKIVEGMAWVSEHGGPEITAYGDTDGKVQIGDNEWRWSVYGGFRGDLTAHMYGADGEHQGWCTLSKGEAGQVRWSRHLIVQSRPAATPQVAGANENRMVMASGVGSSVGEAIAASLGWDFSPQYHHGYTWYRTSSENLAVATFDEQIEIQKTSYPFDGLDWIWTYSSAELAPLLDVIGQGSQVKGWAASQDAAVSAAAGASERVKGAAVLLTGDKSAFELGRAAGRAELLNQIASLKKSGTGDE